MSDASYRAEAHAGGLAFVAFGHWLFAIEPRTGARVWYARTTSSVVEYLPRVAVAGDRVVAAAGTELGCFAHANGAEVWRAKSPIHVFALVVAAGAVIVACNGEAAGLDLDTGALLWHDPYKNLGRGPTALATPEGASAPVPHGKGYA